MAINNFKREEELFLSSLSYLTIGIIGIFTLVSDIKDSEYLEFHAKRSIIYWAISIPLWIFFSIITHYIYVKTINLITINQIFYYLWKIVFVGFGLFMIIYAFYLSYLAYMGKKKSLYLYEKFLKKLGVKL
ncbi:MAG: hypothetical protein ACPLWB_01140 [Caldisericia bacterium]